MKKYINTRFVEGDLEYRYNSNIDSIEVRDVSKYGQPITNYLKDGGIYEMLKGNYEASRLVRKLLDNRSNLNGDISSIVYELNR